MLVESSNFCFEGRRYVDSLSNIIVIASNAHRLPRTASVKP